MADEIGLFEAMYTQRALRYIKPDPIPDELIHKVIDAGIRAPNGGNQQRWGFVVIKDPEIKRKIAERYNDTSRPTHTAPPDRSSARNDRAANYLAEHLAEVPVLILACVRRAEGSGSDISHGASIYPAVQNMLLAARGLGLASVLTTRPVAVSRRRSRNGWAYQRTSTPRPCCPWAIPPGATATEPPPGALWKR